MAQAGAIQKTAADLEALPGASAAPSDRLDAIAGATLPPTLLVVALLLAVAGAGVWPVFGRDAAGLCRVLAGAAAIAIGCTAYALRSARRARIAGQQREQDLLDIVGECQRRRVEVEGRLERLGAYSATIAHDVNNLLSVISLVGSQVRADLPEGERESADELCEAATRAGKLNRGLLALAQQAAAEPVTVDVNTILGTMRRLLGRLVGPDLDVIFRLDERPCLIVADPVQIERVVVNLVTNARDAVAGKRERGERRGRITIETAHTTGLDGESVVLRVSDTGRGMDSATQRLIFEPFFTTKGRRGTGLGLTSVRDIVGAYGGRVEVESRPGVGSRFEVVLPGACVR